MGKLSFATIGTNFIVDRFLNAGKRCDDFGLSVIYSRTKEKARQFGARSCFLEYRICDSLEDLSEDKEVDAVYVASPTALHCRQTIDMLNRRKHVLCEKPAASNAHEWEQMCQAARQSGCILLEATRPVFHPAYEVIRENLDKIGPIRKVFLQYCQYSSRYDNYKKGIIENAFRPELSNGGLMDLGIYCIEVMVGLFGKPSSVSSKALLLPGSIDGQGTILAEYPGMQAIISYSKISDSAMPCEIQGEKGAILWQDVGCPKNVTLKLRGQNRTVIYNESPIPDMVYEIQEFLRLVRQNRNAEAYHAITAESLRITDEVRRQNSIIFPADRKAD